MENERSFYHVVLLLCYLLIFSHLHAHKMEEKNANIEPLQKSLDERLQTWLLEQRSDGGLHRS